MSAYTYLTPIIEEPNWQKFTAAVVLGGALVFLGKKVTSRLRKPSGIEQEIVPAKKMNPFGIIDVLVGTFISYHDSIVGKENRKYVSFTGSIFLFLLAANFWALFLACPPLLVQFG